MHVDGKLPYVVVQTGSGGAPEQLYWFAVQPLVRQGYAVLTFDTRGQGRSDFMTPTGEQGSNPNSKVFWEGLVDAIDFMHSSAARPYPHNESCADSYPTEMTAFNPIARYLDYGRLGIAGHSLGAIGVSVVRLIRRAGRFLHLAEVDMLDGTPILDIKPFVPRFDHRDEVRVGWMEGTFRDASHPTRSDDRF